MVVLESYGLHNSPNYINMLKLGNTVDTTGGQKEMVLIVAYWVETEAEKLTAPLRSEKLITFSESKVISYLLSQRNIINLYGVRKST